MISPFSTAYQGKLAFWLGVALIFVFIQIIIGGTTRLTESGLSITRWEVVKGSLPPLNEAAWQAQFELYKQTPQYELVNKGMTLSDFKFIFFWEWLHRLWGRLGFMFLLAIGLLMAKQLPRIEHKRFVVLLILYAAQGLLGWVMVKSGLVDIPRVSHYRLTAHLLLAIFLFAYILWWIAELLSPQVQKINNTGYKNALSALVGLTILQIIYGAFMSGLRAAIHYPSFPDMNGYIVPPTIFFMQPWYLNFFENIATVQFIHRGIAYLLSILLIIYLIKSKQANLNNVYFQQAKRILPFILLLQITLGVSVLLLSADGTIPVAIGVAHQATGLCLLSTMLFMLFQFNKTQT